MCSGDRSSSAKGAIALRHSAACSWSTSSSSVLSLCTIRGPGCDSVITGQAYGCTGRRPPTTVRRVTDALTVLFMPESAYGPTNQCIGLGKVLLDRGHRVVFAAEASWAGRLEPFGFVEALVDLAEPDPEAGEEAAGQFWIDFINQTAPEFAKPTRDQLATFVQPTYAALVDGARYAEPRLREIIAEHRPDVIVEDNVVSFPALMTSDPAFVRIVSCNPLEVRGDDVPPVFSGYPTADRSRWTDFLEEFDRVHADTWAQWNAWCQEQGTPPLPPREFMHASPSCNLYVFPRELDYTDARPLDDTWYRIDS